MAIRSRFVLAALAALLVIPATAVSAGAETFILVDDTYRTPVGKTLEVAAPGYFANDTLPAVASSGIGTEDLPSHGQLEGYGATGAFTYIPDTGFSGVDSFDYLVRDDTTGEVKRATVTIHVEAVDAVDDEYFVNAGETLTVDVPVAANDTRPASYETALVNSTDHGVLNFAPITATFTYTPDSGFIGTDTFTYRLSNANHPESNDVGTVRINVLAPGHDCAVCDGYCTG